MQVDNGNCGQNSVECRLATVSWKNRSIRSHSTIVSRKKRRCGDDVNKNNNRNGSIDLDRIDSVVHRRRRPMTRGENQLPRRPPLINRRKVTSALHCHRILESMQIDGIMRCSCNDTRRNTNGKCKSPNGPFQAAMKRMKRRVNEGRNITDEKLAKRKR